jgi:hypothetical protein
MTNEYIQMMEERLSSLKDALRVYSVGSVSFSTDKEHYNDEERYCSPKTDFWFRHLDMNGEVYLMNDGCMNAYLELTPHKIKCASMFNHPSMNEEARFEGALFSRFFGDYILTSGGVLLTNIKRNSGEFLTYDEWNKSFFPSSLTFQFYKPYPENKKTCIYRIHTNKVEFDEGIYENKKYPGYYSVPVSPLEVITTLEGESK